MARENSTWGYDRIQGALANIGHKISDSTVANILRQHGIDPARLNSDAGGLARAGLIALSSRIHALYSRFGL
jgi:hypothetical protein